VNLTSVVSLLQLAQMSARAIKPVLITVFTIKLTLFTDLTINFMLISVGIHQIYVFISALTNKLSLLTVFTHQAYIVLV
jgi:hypothetical protein